MDLGDIVATSVVSNLTKAMGKKMLDVATQTLNDYREQNAPEFWKKFDSMVRPLGLEEHRTIPPKIWYPIIDHGTLEDDDFLRTKYAALLANAVDPNFKHEVLPSFIEILKQLTPTEAKVLDDVYAYADKHRVYPVNVSSLMYSTWKDTELKWDRIRLIIRSLTRHGVLDLEIQLPDEFSIYDKSASIDEDRVELNGFGREFIMACQPPQKT